MLYRVQKFIVTQRHPNRVSLKETPRTAVDIFRAMFQQPHPAARDLVVGATTNPMQFAFDPVFVERDRVKAIKTLFLIIFRIS